MEKPLVGVKVIDLSSVLAGPSVATFLAELGAEVIKVENPNGLGDVTQSWRTPSESQDGSSAYYASVNFNKSVIKYDLKTENGQKELRELIINSDVLISNFKEGDDQKFGLDSISILNPSIIHAQLRGFKDNSRVAYDVVIQAECGYMSMNGQSDSPPTKMPLALMDILAAHQLKEGILSALMLRMKDGKGRTVKVNLEESALSALTNQASNYLMNGVVAKQIGSLHPNIAPYGEILNFVSGERVVLAIGSDKHFHALCAILNNEKLALKPEFLDNQQRVINRNEMILDLQSLASNIEFKTFIKRCNEQNVPVGVIKNLEDALSSSTAKSLFREENQLGKPTKRLSSVAFDIQPF